MKKMHKSLAFYAAFIMSSAIIAQDAPTPEEIFVYLDRNKDGFIVKNEAQGPLLTYFANIDTGRDQKISLAELQTSMADMGRRPVRPPEPSPIVPEPVDQAARLSDAQAKCAELGFTPGTEKFGNCVLKVSR
jgi:hypothetical protein